MHIIDLELVLWLMNVYFNIYRSQQISSHFKSYKYYTKGNDRSKIIKMHYNNVTIDIYGGIESKMSIIGCRIEYDSSLFFEEIFRSLDNSRFDSNLAQ